MSIVESLKRLFDPATQRYEEAERAADRDTPQLDEDGDPPRITVDAAPAEAPEAVRRRCRLCGYESWERDAFCPDCLADTMQPPP